jgi:type IV secretory pathway TrbL component
MSDPRIPVPAALRNLGIIGGILMMILGLFMAWRRAGEDPTLPQTGWK